MSGERNGSGPTAEQRQAIHELARFWPEKGNRHFAYRHLLGGVLRGGTPEGAAEQLVAVLTEATGDDQAQKRIALVEDTAAKLLAKKPVTGWPKLSALLGAKADAAILRLRKSLGQVIDLEMLASHKGLPVEFLASLGLHDLPQGGVGVPYTDTAGRQAAIKQRAALKADDGSYWPTGTPLLPYGEWKIDAAAEAGFLVLVEGESDCWSAWFHGYPALGIPGADTVHKTLMIGHVGTLKRLYVVEETDAAGKTFVANVARRLREIGWRGEARVVRLGVKDVSELHLQNPDHDAFRKALQAALDRAEFLPRPQPSATVGSVGRVKLRRLSPYSPFPTDSLPQPLGDYVSQAAKALGCDAAFVALPVLSVVAATIGNTRAIRLKKGWVEPSVVWSAIVGDSGTLKSPAYWVGVSHLLDLQREMFAEHAAKMVEYNNELFTYKKEHKGPDKPSGPPPGPPVQERIVVSDVTIEKLAEILEDNPRGVLVARDELAGWIGSFTRYKGKQGGSDLPNWLEVHRAGTIAVDRKTGDRRTIFVQRAAVSVTGGIQPGVLVRSLTADFLEAGGAARVLLAMPPKLAKQWTEAEIGEDVEDKYRSLIKALLDLEFRVILDGPRKGEKGPHALLLSPEAKQEWVRFYNDWAREQAAVEGELAAAFSKLEAYAARFALVHHVVTHVALETGDLREVGVRSIRAGIALCGWFADEARRIYATLTESVQERDARRLVEFIQARGSSITVRQLQNANSRKYPDTASAEAALQALAEAGYAQWVGADAPARGGHRPRTLHLLPTADTSDTRPGEDEGESDEGDGEASDTRSDGRQTGPTTNPWFVTARGQSAKTYDGAKPQAAERVSEVSAVGSECSGSEGVADEGMARDQASERVSEASVGRGVGDGAVSATPPKSYLLVRDAAGLEAVRAALLEPDPVGLDLETTGLNPRRDRVRLLSLAVPTGEGGDLATYLVDCFAVDPAPLWDALADKPLLLHNGQFDMPFLMRLGFEPGRVTDTMLRSQLLDGTRRPKGYHSLQQCVRRELGRDLNKDLQASDWSGDLSPEQLAYAADDAAVLVELHAALDSKIKAAGLERVADIENRCLPAVAWMALRGVGFDTERWRAQAARAEAEAQRLGREMDRLAPRADQAELFSSGWNWDSPPQAMEVFRRLGVALESSEDDALAAAGHPLAPLLRDYRAARKGCTTYGLKWLKHVAEDGRVYAGWRQIGSDAGRMSCRTPNMQQLPKDDACRGCVPAPPGRVLVKADYSQIELRIAAKVANEKKMLDAYRRGFDLHSLTAARITGKAESEVTREDRKLAKAVTDRCAKKVTPDAAIE